MTARRRLLHVLTPGDHFSPRTGSAVPTVVDGLSRATPADERRPAVLVASGTYAERYASADAIEYPYAPRSGPAARGDRYLDAALGRLTGSRPASRRLLAPAFATQREWPDSTVLAHNLPQAIGLVDTARHAAVLYAHNDLLRSYSAREAGAALGGSAAIVCVSDYLAQVTSDHLPAGLRGRIRVVRNGVDTTTFTAPERPDDGILSVVFVGRTIPDKGPDVLVDAVVRLGRPDVRLDVVGGAGFAPDAPLTPYEVDLRRRADASAGTVRFRPFVERGALPAILGAADVAVVPSRWPDPCPLTVLEGMAAGAAVVASSMGGIPELLGDAGLAVPADDPGALAAALAGLADDPGELRRRQAASRAQAEARDWSRVHDELVHQLAGTVDVA